MGTCRAGALIGPYPAAGSGPTCRRSRAGPTATTCRSRTPTNEIFTLDIRATSDNAGIYLTAADPWFDEAFFGLADGRVFLMRLR